MAPSTGGAILAQRVGGPQSVGVLYWARSMMQTSVRWRLCLAALALVLLGPFLFLACQGDETTGAISTQIGLSIVTVTPAPTPAPTPVVVVVVSATAAPTPVANVCPDNPNPASPSMMVVEEPKPSDHLTSPAYVRGWGVGIGFQGQGVHVAVYDSTGEPLNEVKGPPLPKEGRIPPPGLDTSEFTAPFDVDITFKTTNSQPGCVRVFGVSSADGQPVNVVQVPVLLQP